MSGSDRGKGIAPLEALFCVLALLGLAAIVYATGGALGVEAGRNEVTAREHYEREKESALQSCINTVGKNAVQCATEAVESAQEKSETRQDLYAQKDAARWGFWAMMIAAVSSLVTALGTVLLYQQIVLTRKAVEDTDKATAAMVRQNEIAFEKERGHLRFVNCIANDGKININVFMNFEKIGNSICEIQGASFAFKGNPLFNDYIEEAVMGLQVKISPNSIGNITITCLPGVSFPTFLIGNIIYKTAGTSGLKSFFCLHLTKGVGNDGTNLVPSLATDYQPNDT